MFVMVVKLASLLCVVATVAGIAVPVPQGPLQPAPALQTGPVTFQPAPFTIQTPRFTIQPAPVAVQPAPLAFKPAPLAVQKVLEPEEPVAYEYEYSIQDPNSGDIKQQKENRNGDDVRGFYTLVQPDGLQRIVEYTSSKEHGFNAIVRYQGQQIPAPVKAVAPVALAPAPSVAKFAVAPAPAQITYAQPQPAVAYAPAPQVSYAPAPVTRVAYAQAPQVTYAQAPQVAYAQAPQVAYAQAPHVTYAQPAPVAYAQAPQVTYAQPVSYAQAPAQVTYQRLPFTYSQQAQVLAQAPINKRAYTQAQPVEKPGIKYA